MARARRAPELARAAQPPSDRAAPNVAGQIAPPGPAQDRDRQGAALHYLNEQWAKLTVFLSDGRVPLDNNPAENAIRPFVIGRKNWLFSHTPRRAHASGALYSLLGTAKANGLEPHDYLLDVITRRVSRLRWSDLPRAQGPRTASPGIREASPCRLLHAAIAVDAPLESDASSNDQLQVELAASSAYFHLPVARRNNHIDELALEARSPGVAAALPSISQSPGATANPRSDIP